MLLGIVQGSISTVTICTWTSVHPNISAAQPVEKFTPESAKLMFWMIVAHSVGGQAVFFGLRDGPGMSITSKSSKRVKGCPNGRNGIGSTLMARNGRLHPEDEDRGERLFPKGDALWKIIARTGNAVRGEQRHQFSPNWSSLRSHWPV